MLSSLAWYAKTLGIGAHSGGPGFQRTCEYSYWRERVTEAENKLHFIGGHLSNIDWTRAGHELGWWYAAGLWMLTLNVLKSEWEAVHTLPSKWGSCSLALFIWIAVLFG